MYLFSLFFLSVFYESLAIQTDGGQTSIETPLHTAPRYMRREPQQVTVTPHDTKQLQNLQVALNGDILGAKSYDLFQTSDTAPAVPNYFMGLSLQNPNLLNSVVVSPTQQTPTTVHTGSSLQAPANSAQISTAMNIQQQTNSKPSFDAHNSSQVNKTGFSSAATTPAASDDCRQIENYVKIALNVTLGIVAAFYIMQWYKVSASIRRLSSLAQQVLTFRKDPSAGSRFDSMTLFLDASGQAPRSMLRRRLDDLFGQQDVKEQVDALFDEICDSLQIVLRPGMEQLCDGFWGYVTDLSNKTQFPFPVASKLNYSWILDGFEDFFTKNRPLDRETFVDIFKLLVAWRIEGAIAAARASWSWRRNPVLNLEEGRFVTDIFIISLMVEVGSTFVPINLAIHFAPEKKSLKFGSIREQLIQRSTADSSAANRDVTSDEDPKSDEQKSDGDVKSDEDLKSDQDSNPMDGSKSVEEQKPEEGQPDQSF